MKNRYIRAMQAIEEIREEYIGMDGFIPETAPEEYLQSVLRRIYNIATDVVKINKYKGYN